MMIDFLRRKFTTRRKAEDRSPVPMFWVGDDEEATLINPDSGRVHAYIWHDGCRKYHPTVIVSPWRAFHLVRHGSASVASLLSLPRCTVELYRLRADSIAEAKELAEHGLGIGD
jgi:hypothetical protein